VPESYPPEPIEYFSEDGLYEFALRSQAGAEERLREFGAVDELEQAVLAHCEEYRPPRPTSRS
jgi:hypothetical protein